MSEKINLPELVNQIKQDLMQQELGGAETAPLFSVDEVTIAVQAKVTKDADAGIKIYVVELGGGGGKEDVQTITLKLESPEKRVKIFDRTAKTKGSGYGVALLHSKNTQNP